MAFLPTTKKEIEQLGWDVPDFVLVTGDAYVLCRRCPSELEYG